MRISDWSSDVCSSDLRLAAEVRRPQHLRFGLLNEVADIDDVVVLQAVGRTDRQLKLVDLAEQVPVELELVVDLLDLMDRLRLLEVDEELKLVLKDARGQRHRILRRDQRGRGSWRDSVCQ